MSAINILPIGVGPIKMGYYGR